MIYILNSQNIKVKLEKSDLVNLLVKSNLKLKKVGGNSFWNRAIHLIDISEKTNLFVCVNVEDHKTIILGFTLCVKGTFLFLIRVFLNKLITCIVSASSELNIQQVEKKNKSFKTVIKTHNGFPFDRLKLFRIWHFSPIWNRIELIWIDNNYRGKGLGEQLYYNVLYFYSQSNSQKLLALVNRDNQASIALHFKTNWDAIICNNKNILFTHIPSKHNFV